MSSNTKKTETLLILWALLLLLFPKTSDAQTLDSLFMRDQKILVGLVQSVSADSLVILQDKDGNQTSLSLALSQISHAVYRDGMKQVFEASLPGGSAEVGVPGEGQYVSPQTDAEMYAQGVQDGKDSLRRSRGRKYGALGGLVFGLGLAFFNLTAGLGLLLAVAFLVWVILKKPNLEKNKYLNKDYLNSQPYREGATKGIKTMKALGILKGILIFLLSYILLAVAAVFLIIGALNGGW